MPLPALRAPFPRRAFVGAALAAAALSISSTLPAFAANAHQIDVDFAADIGPIKLLNGINKGPIAPGGLVNVIEGQKALHLPWIRLHDCHWPYTDVVDYHAVFPNLDADPSDPKNYDFARTDTYIEGALQTGAGIIYRLGESIEHEKVKRYVLAPKDPAHWAEIGIGIIRHYNEGWKDGFHMGIPYWEIWNEPENRPAMWDSTDEAYLDLYRTAARAIKAKFPALKVGGPALGGFGSIENGELKPSEFLIKFLEMCKHDSVPLDFFSWHCYTDDTQELSARSRGVRKLLDSYGFTKTESHLNEWNYLPGKSWRAWDKETPHEERQKDLDLLAGIKAGTFIATSLIELQDVPLDVTTLFHGELGGLGLFSETGAPYRCYYGMKAFGEMTLTPKRVKATGAIPGKLAVLAGHNEKNTVATVLISNYTATDSTFDLRLAHLPWTGPTKIEVVQVNGQENWEKSPEQIVNGVTPFTISLPAPSIALVTLTKVAAAGSR